MSFLKQKSLIGKMLAIYLPLVSLSVVILFGILEARFYFNSRDELVSALKQLVSVQDAAFADAVWEIDADQINLLMADIGHQSDVRGAKILDTTGEILGSIGDFKTPPELPEFRAEHELTYKTQGIVEKVGKLVVTVHSDRIRSEIIDRIKLDSLILIVLALSLAGVTILATHIVIGRPVSRLRVSIEKLQNENIREQVDWNSSDELGQVVHAYNEMQTNQAIAENELKRHRDHLEDLVSKRTKAFEEAKNDAEKSRYEAESATKAKASFLATMSHEIRTPMNGVIGMVDMLMETKLEDDQHQMMRTVRDSAYALLTIINDILDFSKIEAGKLEFEAIPFSIRDTVEGMAETLGPNARTKGIRINIHVDPEIPDAVIGDQGRIRQILFNIGGNAIKFTEEGRVLIRAHRVPNKDKTKATLRFDIIDSGIGISEEAQVSLFQEFSQAESSTTRRFGGTGLGLSICLRLTEMMDGKIEVESEFGKGSTFIVTLTFTIAEDHAIKSDGHDLTGLNVLLLSGDVEVGELDAKYLRHWNAEVSTCGNIEEVQSLALKAVIEKKPFDVFVIGSAWSQETQAAQIEAIQNESELAGGRFVLMTETRTKAERKEITNTIYVESDPLRRASFIQGVAVAAGRASPDVSYDEEAIPSESSKAPTVEEALAAGTLILVAEDNPTNRDVIGRQLTLLGYASEFRDDGKQALEAWRSKSYAILLTDCHMPEMDGFELTQTIRDAEQDGGRRIPIIAITASALEAEVNRCYEAGMDDFLANPLEMPKLKAALKKWMSVAGSASPVETAAESVPAAEDSSAKSEDLPDADSGDAPGDGGDGPIDPQALKSVFGDDEATFKEILKEFVDPATSNVSEIEVSFAERSADGVAKAAHKLKSSARSVGANELADLCQTLETAGKARDWDEIDRAAPHLPNTMDKVVEYIDNL